MNFAIISRPSVGNPNHILNKMIPKKEPTLNPDAENFKNSFLQACNTRANADFLKLNDTSTLTPAEFDEQYVDFFELSLPVYVYSMFKGRDILLRELNEHGYINVQDPVSGDLLSYDYDPKTGRVSSNANSEIALMASIDFLDMDSSGLESGSDSVCGLLEGSGGGSSHIYELVPLVNYMLQEGMSQVTSEYREFYSALRSLWGFSNSALKNIKRIPRVQAVLNDTEKYVSEILQSEEYIDQLSWFVAKIRSNPELVKWSQEAQKTILEADLLENFFTFPSKSRRRVDNESSEKSLAINLLTGAEQLSRAPTVSIADVLEVNKKVIGVLQENPNAFSDRESTRNIARQIVLEKVEVYAKLLKQEGFPIHLGLDYFVEILADYLQNLPDQEVVDYLQGTEEEYVVYNMLGRHYNVQVGDLESKYQSVAVFISDLRKGRFSSTHIGAITEDDLRLIYDQLLGSDTSAFKEGEKLGAIHTVLKHYGVVYNDGLQAYIPNPDQNYTQQEISRFIIFIDSLLKNIEFLPAGTVEMFRQIRLQGSLRDLLDTVREEADARSLVIFEEHLFNLHPWIRQYEVKKSERIFLDLELFADYHLTTIGRRLLTSLQSGGYYTANAGYEAIEKAALDWAKNTVEADKALKAFGFVDKEQLATYLAIRLQSKIFNLLQTYSSDTESFDLQLNNTKTHLLNDGSLSQVVSPLIDSTYRERLEELESFILSSSAYTLTSDRPNKAKVEALLKEKSKIKNAESFAVALRYFDVRYSPELEAYIPNQAGEYSPGEIAQYKDFVNFTTSNLEALPDEFVQMLVQIRLREEVSAALQSRRDKVFNRLDTSKGTDFSLQVFTEASLVTLYHKALVKAESSGDYYRSVSLIHIESAVSEWVKSIPNLDKIGEIFGLDSSQLTSYLSLRLYSVIESTQIRMPTTSESLVLELENSKSQFERDSVAREKFRKRAITRKEFNALSSSEQLELIESVFDEESEELRAQMALDIFEMLKIRYAGESQKFVPRHYKSESSLVRAKRLRAFRKFVTLLYDKVEDPTIREVVMTSLLQYRLKTENEGGVPPQFKGKLGSNRSHITPVFIDFYKETLGKWDGSTGHAKALYTVESLPEVVDLFCAEYKDLIEERVKVKNQNIKKEEHKYDIAKFRNELLDYMQYLFDMTYRTTVGVHRQTIALSEEYIVNSLRENHLARSLRI